MGGHRVRGPSPPLGPLQGPAARRALQTLLAERTALIIAHRRSTVEIADRVLVMQDGRIVEDGSPAGLVAGIGRFADLHQAWADSLV